MNIGIFINLIPSIILGMRKMGVGRLWSNSQSQHDVEIYVIMQTLFQSHFLIKKILGGNQKIY